jgi:hypothetical protein
MCLPVSRLFWVSSLAYPNLLGTKGYVVVVVVVVVYKIAEHSTDSEEADERQLTGAVAPERVRPRGRGRSAGTRVAVERARGREVGARAVAARWRRCGPARDDDAGWNRSNGEGKEGVARPPRRRLTGDLPAARPGEWISKPVMKCNCIDMMEMKCNCNGMEMYKVHIAPYISD